MSFLGVYGLKMVQFFMFFVTFFEFFSLISLRLKFSKVGESFLRDKNACYDHL